MNRRKLLENTALILLGLALPGVAVAQEAFPTKPITLIVPSAAGGGVDLASRRIGEKMAEYLKQPVIVENRPGAGTVQGIKVAMSAPADGYTIFAQASTLSMLPYTLKDFTYDPLKDFAPVGIMLRQTNVFSTGGKQSYKSIPDLLADAKKNPGALTYAHGGLGSPQHYTVELVLAAVGAKMQGIQYQGAGSSFVDVVAGRVTIISSGYQGQASFFPDHQLKPLAVTSAERIKPLPDVPTLRELGIDVVSQAWIGLLANKDVPQDRISKLSDAIKYALADKKVQEQFLNEGSDPTFVTPAQFHDILVEEGKTFGDLAKKTGIVPQ